eukprot:6197516-Pleurochrysis_carterae.AAC.1
MEAVLSYGIRDPILIDPANDAAELKQIKREACQLINAASHGHRVRLTFSTDRKDPMPKVNGNVWKEMTKPGFFIAVLDSLHLIHQCQTPVRPEADPTGADGEAAATDVDAAAAGAEAASTSTEAAANLNPPGSPSAAGPARPTPKRSPFKPPVAEQAEQRPARRQRRTAAADFRDLMAAEAAGLDAEMEEEGGLQAYLDAESARIRQLGEDNAAEPDEESSELPQDPPIDELEQARLAMESTFQYRFISCLQSILDHWAFVTDKRMVFIAQRDGVTIEERTRLRDEAEKLGRAIAVSFVALLGASKRCSYLHAFVYAFPNMIYELGHILRDSMEGFEHGNKLTKHIYLRRTSAGGRTNSAGIRHHRQAQALERRREGTVSAHELGLINTHSSLRQFLKPEHLYTQKFNVKELVQELV